MDEIRIMPKEEIRRRLAAMTGEPNVKRLDEVTLRDVARWLGVTRDLVRWHESGYRTITDAMQIPYSRFFALLDAGRIKIELGGANRSRKTLVVVDPPPEPPKRKVRPYVDLATMKLRLD